MDGHRVPPPDKTPQETLDRVAAKCIRVSFNPKNCKVRQETLSFEDLKGLKRYSEDDHHPSWEVDPIVVLVYQGRRFIIDGRRRVTKWVNEENTTPRRALIIEPREI
ncbi:MAG: hypothetical protein HY038_05055 [Nitrospirae bacterium]|nr:hypothetical protein [Nitrospirota bacterium]